MASALAGAAAPVAAQSPDLTPGGVIQSVRDFDTIPARPRADLALPAASVDAPAVPGAQADGPALQVSGFRIEGNSVFDDAELQAVVGTTQPQSLTLAQLDGLAARITAYYRAAGYSMAQAYIPEQEVPDGVVRIEVVEGVLSNVVVERGENLRLRQSRIDAALAILKPGQPVHMPTLERALLLLSDNPGIEVRSALRPGQAPQTVELVVQVEQESLIQSRVVVDNFGNDYTGKHRAGLAVQLNDLTGLGDRIDLGVMRSEGDLRNFNVRWEVPVGSSGLRAHAGYAEVDYRLGSAFDVLDITGRAAHVELGLKYPVLRSRDVSASVYTTLAHDRYDERIGLLQTDNPKSSRSVQVGMSGQWRDGFATGGVNLWDVSATFGRLDIKSEVERTWDAETARRDGSYSKFNLSLERLQRLDDSWSLSLAARGQLASGNLDSSSRFYLGGPNGVRAFESGEGGGDEGLLGSLELRRRIHGGLHAFGFFDMGHIRVNKYPWTNDKNSYDVHAYGVGAHWDFGRYGYLRAVYALRPHDNSAWDASGNRNRLWLSASLAPEALPALFAAGFPAAKPDASGSSRVEVYGVLNTDIEIASRKGATPESEGRGATPAAAPTGVDMASTYRMQSNSSEFGIRGSESLGGGARAWYQIESSLNSATGTGTLAGRNTAVGLRSRHWGNVLFGKWDSPYKSATSGFDPFGGTQVTAYYNILGNPGFGVSTGSTSSPIKTATDRSSSNGDASFSRRQENSIQYWTPRWNGFSARAMVALSGEKLSPYAGTPSIWAVNAGWRDGPLQLVAAYEQHDNFFGVASIFSRGAAGRGIGSRIGPLTETSSRDYGIKLGARYDMGNTRISLIWERLVYSQSGVVPADAPTLMRYQRDAIWLGVRHRTGPWTFQGSAGYADAGSCQVASVDPAQQGCDTDGLDAYMLSLGAKYSLSRRTEVYVQYARIFNGRSASYNFSPGGVFGAGVGSDPQAYGLGMIHRF
ncbi:porin [Pusillimonas noertemannii]|uniref:porin n=1 Tax=Pusillimonas noertemannii TaxID=305977 RepID=UPI00333F5C69